MNILTQNAKMKISSQNGIDVYNFGIPAFQSETGFRTCPMAGACATGCYARSGTYRFKNSINAYQERLNLTQSKHFVDIMVAEITVKYLKSFSKGNQCIIRIHDAGDFYNRVYLTDWVMIMEKCPNVRFYAYTKMVAMFEDCKAVFPSNFRYIYSFGGKQDSQIDTNNHYHSKVFQSETELLAASYIDATQDDMVAALGVSKRIGLVYHGVKNYTNTLWSGVLK